jgi:hypothetical protein
MTNEEFKELKQQTIAGIADIISEETGLEQRDAASPGRAAERIYDSLSIDYADERGRFIRLKPEAAEETPAESS